MDPVGFVSDLSSFHPETTIKFESYKEQYEFDISGIQQLHRHPNTIKKGDDLKGTSSELDITSQGFSNAMVTGASLNDLEWQLPASNIVSMGFVDMTSRLFGSTVLNAELTKQIVEGIEEQESETETDWHCKGCNKYFATKGSLKRHHDRKASCKEIINKNVVVPEVDVNIFTWVEQILQAAISGDTDKPYCKHCDVEFANKSNLNKHYAKSPACDKLAKNAFLECLNEKKEAGFIKRETTKKENGISPFNVSSRLATSVAVTNFISS